MSAETVRLLHLVLDKLDRLVDKGDEADWQAVAAIILEETRDADYHPRPARLREILAIAERHMIKGVPPVKPNVETEQPAPDALGERAPQTGESVGGIDVPSAAPEQGTRTSLSASGTSPDLSPFAGMETTPFQRKAWGATDYDKSQNIEPAYQWRRIEMLCRDIDRLTAEIARLTAELAEARGFSGVVLVTQEKALADVAKARGEEREAASHFMDSATRGLYALAISTGGEI